jgi:hypothetical protein
VLRDAFDKFIVGGQVKIEKLKVHLNPGKAGRTGVGLEQE